MDFKNFNIFVEDILSKKNIDSLLEELIKKITSLLSAQRATFFFYNEDVKELWSYVAKDLDIGSIRAPIGKGISGQTALKRKSLNIKDAYKCSYFDKNVDTKTGFRTKSVLTIPLITREDKLLGVIQVINKKKGSFNQQDEIFLKSISYYIVIALENIKLLQEKETFFRSVLYALTGAIDAKDPVTAGHSHRVAYLSVRIGAAMKFSEQEIKILEYSAYLHDVGKIGISDKVLLKKGKFSKEEYEVMKQHPVHTLQILRNIIFPRSEQEIPYIASSHHEFLDGSGYPSGLKGKEINNYARIIAVADIYDAIISFDRPYKAPGRPKEALEILKEEVKKKHLDKKIVNIFIKNELYKGERRRYKRLDLNICMSYQVISHERVFKKGLKEKSLLSASELNILNNSSIESTDISAGGVLFLTKAYLPVGTYLDLELDISTLHTKCVGKVVWIEKVIGTPHYKVGVSFMGLSASIKDKISDNLLALSSAKKQFKKASGRKKKKSGKG